jgi:Bifunctional DNA primase/polymerase, N-terminal
MAMSTVRGGRAPARRLKSPLAVPGASAGGSSDNFGSPAPASGRAALTDREATLAEFQGYLRTVNNRAGRPFEEKTITAYSDPVKSLDKWMTAKEMDGDFDAVDTALLNKFFREYYLVRGQGGTHTLQRNLIPLRSALALASRGWQVFPCAPGGKQPALGLDTRPSASQARGWQVKAPPVRQSMPR